MGMLADWSCVDVSLAEHSGNPAKLRRNQDNAFLEGMGQTFTGNLFYGNNTINPAEFMGLAAFYNTVNTATAANAANVLNGGGTGSSNTSLWLLGLAPNKIYGVFPRGSRAGLKVRDFGDSVPAYDSLGNPFMAYQTYFEHQGGICPQDWRYGARAANIDTTNAGLAGTNALDLFATMAEMVLKFPELTLETSGIVGTDAEDGDGQVRAMWFCNRTVRHWMDIQMLRNKGVLLRIEDYAGKPTDAFRGMPIGICDQIINTEATIN